MRHQKMISLDSKTLKLAEEKPNFSEWVRSKLLENNQDMKRWKYECHECEYQFHVSSKLVDLNFQCQRRLWYGCTNDEILQGVDIS